MNRFRFDQLALIGAMPELSISTVLSSLSILVGVFLMVRAIRVFPRPRAKPTTNQPATDPSWRESTETQLTGPDASIARRAAILSGLQLTVLTMLLLGALYLAGAVTADQLVRLGY